MLGWLKTLKNVVILLYILTKYVVVLRYILTHNVTLLPDSESQ